MVLVRERSFGDISISSKHPFVVEITENKVVIKQGPIKIVGVEKITEDPVEENLKRAFAQAAGSLIKNNLPESYDQPEEVTDKLNILDRATRTWLDRGRGKKKLSITIDASAHDAGLLAEFQSVNPSMLDACIKRLEAETQKTFENHREREYQRKAIRN